MKLRQLAEEESEQLLLQVQQTPHSNQHLLGKLDGLIEKVQHQIELQ